MPAHPILPLTRPVRTPEDAADSASGSGFSTGCTALDAHLPGGRLELGALHEIQGASYRDRAAALGVMLALIARRLHTKPGPVIWCEMAGQDPLPLHAPGLVGAGIDPAIITRLKLRHERDFLWAMEEAFDCSAVAIVAGTLQSERLYDFTASRRLALRARKSGVSGFLLRPHGAAGTSAAATRWQVASRPSPDTHPSYVSYAGLRQPLGPPRWQLDISRSRGAKPGTVNAIWNHAALSFDLDSRLVDQSALPADQPADAEWRSVI